MELDDDCDIHHYDFSTASDLELFIAHLEEILHDWRLTNRISQKEAPSNCNFRDTNSWNCRTEKLQFSDVEFELTNFYFLKDNSEAECPLSHDLLSKDNDFCRIMLPPSAGPHPLVRWFGIRNFIVLAAKNPKQFITESKIKILLSCLNVAVSNSNCSIPLFLQCQEKWQNFFLGVSRYSGFRTDFEMVHLAKTPSHSKYLTGLISLFKSKIGSCDFKEPLTIASRFSFVLKEWVCETRNVENNWDLGSLPFGAVLDLKGEFHLRAVWPKLLDNSVVDGETYSDLEPMQAPLWQVTVFLPGNPACLLTEHFGEFLVLGKYEESSSKILGRTDKTQQIPPALAALTQSKITQKLSSVLRRKSLAPLDTESQIDDDPLQKDNLMLFLYYLFPDADKNSKYPYSGETKNDKNWLSKVKASPFDSLTWRFAVIMAQVVHSFGGVKSAACLWMEFVEELRYRCENSIPIPGVETGFISHRNCLLYQKLQLLNCCILRRLARDKSSEDSNESDDEEFFDASDSMDEDKTKLPCSDKPLGRKSKHGNKTVLALSPSILLSTEKLLLLATGEPLYIPHTQEPAPKTEDQLEKQADFLLNLSTDSEGSELRARIMSETLLSDMEAFKAANPGCVLADFIRWFSPRDWIEEIDEFGEKKGHLSSRMEIPGNTWQDVWSIAKAIPAKWQKRLFDDTKESENILRFLETRSPQQFMLLLMPNLFAVILHQLYLESAVTKVSGVQEALGKLSKRMDLFCRDLDLPLKKYEEIAGEVAQIEIRLVQAEALRKKFLAALDEPSASAETYNELQKFLALVLDEDDVEVPGGSHSPIGAKICNFFKDAIKAEQLTPDVPPQLTPDKWTIYSAFPPANEKEFILRVNTSKGPQRLFASLKKNEFRLCGAFTSPELVIY